MTTLNLGIIGTGLAVEKLHWPALLALEDRYKVTAFCDLKRSSAEHFADYADTDLEQFTRDYHALLDRDDVDVVLISLPIPLAAQAIEHALEAGKHVLCEKPQASNFEEATVLWSVVDQYLDQKLIIAENWFYRDDLRYAMTLLQGGEIGRVHTMSFRRLKQLIPRDGEFSSTPWRWQGAYEGGPHLDGGVHQVAMMRMLMGDIDRISGEVQDANETHGGPSQLATNLRFVDNAIGSFMLGSPSAEMPPDENGMRIYGTQGVMSINDERILVWKDGKTTRHEVERQDFGYINEFHNFHDAVVHDSPIIGDFYQSWRGMEFVHLALRSAEEGAVIHTDRDVAPLEPWPIDLWLPHGETSLNLKVEVTSAKGYQAG